VKRPASLTIAVVLQWISAIAGIWVGFIFLLGSLAMFDPEARADIASALAEAQVTDIGPDMVVVAFLLLAAVLIAISVIRLIIAISLGRGRSWARIVITVFAVISAATAVAQAVGGEWLSGIVTIVIEAVILWLMWNKSSSAYIKARSAERAAAAA